ncbi:MAG: Slp family lipoprotein [Gammaproteobacteria bacterium]
MNVQTIGKVVFGSLLLTFAAGCASTIPPSIKSVPATSPQVAEVLVDAQAYEGEQVRWGGSIAGVENRENETWVEIVARDLNRSGRPKYSDHSDGRFLAVVEGFLDPAVYAKDRQLTVSGTIEGKQSRTIGDYPYTYPLVQVDSHYLWEPQPKRAYGYGHPYYPYHYGFSYGYPFYPRHHHYRHHHRKYKRF